jgi:hypothetical protein
MNLIWGTDKVEVNLSLFFTKQNAKNMYVDSTLCQKTDVNRKKLQKFRWKAETEIRAA